MSHVVAPLADVLAVIATAVLGDERDDTEVVGTVTLHDHQRDALRRVRASIRETGGALLADEPGLGKTYVALALAREYPATIVVAPAALRAMWRSASALAGVDVSFVSMEALSRRGAQIESYAASRDALVIVLDEGRLPTRAELRAWVAGDDAVQLAFPMLVSREAEDAPRLRAVLRSHVDGVQALRARIRNSVERDSYRRARVLRDLRRMYPGARIVAFTAHASTAEALFRAMRRDAGVALLTARGARSAGGARPRADVVDALAGTATAGCAVGRRSAHLRDQISLVIATDLLSEGVNLQGASVVVHLDVPWTPAGLDQRVGRAARIGSAHDCVHVHGFAAPAAAQALLALDRRIARKRSEQGAAARAPDEAERLRAVVRAWKSRDVRNLEPGECLVASAFSSHDGFLAVVDGMAGGMAVCAGRRAGRRWRVSDAPADVLAVAGAVRPSSADHDASVESTARSALDRWIRRRVAHEQTGAAGPPSRARRTLLARLDSAVRAASAHDRAAVAQRISRVRSLVRQAVSAGAEEMLAELREAEFDGLEGLLAACETRLGGASQRATRPAVARPAVRALLIVRRCPPTAPPSVSP